MLRDGNFGCFLRSCVQTTTKWVGLVGWSFGWLAGGLVVGFFYDLFMLLSSLSWKWTGNRWGCMGEILWERDYHQEEGMGWLSHHIMDHGCGWLVVGCLNRVNPAQLITYVQTALFFFFFFLYVLDINS